MKFLRNYGIAALIFTLFINFRKIIIALKYIGTNPEIIWDIIGLFLSILLFTPILIFLLKIKIDK